MIEFVNGGLGVIGTPEQAVAQIETLLEQSNGGFGAYLTLAHNWANPEATKKSYELLARHVMPRFQSSGGGLVDAANRAQALRPALAEKQLQAVEEATERYEAEKGAIEAGTIDDETHGEILTREGKAADRTNSTAGNSPAASAVEVGNSHDNANGADRVPEAHAQRREGTNGHHPHRHQPRLLGTPNRPRCARRTSADSGFRHVASQSRRHVR